MLSYFLMIGGVLMGHQLKDPDVTVGYQTGEGPKASGEARGAWSNAPIRVTDDLAAIIEAMGG